MPAPEARPRSIAFSELAGFWAPTPAAARQGFDKALADARKGISLAPELGEGHLALAKVFASVLDFTHASEHYERAVALAAGNAQVLQDYGFFAVLMSRTDAGIPAARRAVALDPLNRNSHGELSETLLRARHYNEAIAPLQEALALDPDYAPEYGWLTHYVLGNYQDTGAFCEIKPDDWTSQMCLAMTYDKLGRQADAEAQLAKLKASSGDASAFQYAEIYAQWGNTAQALSWLDTAMRLRDPGLVLLNRPAHGPLAQRAALPGDRAGAEVSGLSGKGDFDASASVPREIVPVSALWKTQALEVNDRFWPGRRLSTPSVCVRA